MDNNEQDSGQEYSQQQQNEWQSKENAKARAQNYLTQNQNKGGNFTAGQDYTGGASSIGKGSFTAAGKKGIGSAINDKYAFKAPE